ncbi:hypothetical protein [Marinithermus hydrothermalis]|uniref:Uncharacterized protein n=1 Tax=Marinithermus hydrothermalis (strain DSM 14884 / JCM 11576 / T1) TaxID=869210 RepID=F2NME4_MARHT|nr:hypothetical protein [Marinithermus hydrothermalis]AEB11832.1 hypothetical protein Marky_1090 [Marinithermus hydrothermalis DSM 14884]
MRRIWVLFFTLVLTLVGCSGSTLTTLKVDLASFIAAQGFDSGEVSPASGTVYLPAGEDGRADLPDGGQLVQLPSLEVLERAAITVRLNLTNQGTASTSFSIAVYIAPDSESNIYQETYRVGQTAQLLLAAGETGPLELVLALSETENLEAFNRVRAGRFRVGLRLDSGGGTVAYTVTTAEVSVSGRLFALIPDA